MESNILYLLTTCDILKIILPITPPVNSSLNLFILQQKYYHLKQLIFYLNVFPLLTKCHINNYIKLLLNSTLNYYSSIWESELYIDNYSDAIKTSNQYVKVTKDSAPNIKLFALKMISYLSIAMESEHEKREYYFDVTTNTTESNGLNAKLSHIQLLAAIRFHGINFDEMLSVFKPQFWTDNYSGIGLHGYRYDIVKFLLRHMCKYLKENANNVYGNNVFR